MIPAMHDNDASHRFLVPVSLQSIHSEAMRPITVGTTKKGMVRPIKWLLALNQSRKAAGASPFQYGPSVRPILSMTPAKLAAPQTARILKARRTLTGFSLCVRNGHTAAVYSCGRRRI